MFRRVCCLLGAIILIFSSVPAVSEPAVENGSYDFDFVFRLNADAFPELLRSRAAGYAALVNRLGIRGNISWNTATRSMDLDATLYYTDKPDLSYPFRIYGIPSRIFITSPLINNKIILLNMIALMEFSIKAKNTLGVPLPYIALLIPFTTENAMDGLLRSWQEVIGNLSESGEISYDRFSDLSARWSEEFLNNDFLHWWIMGLSDGSDAPSVVETEMYNLPGYIEKVTDGQSVSVSLAPGSRLWQDAAGNTLFFRRESDTDLFVDLSLPASENGYVPSFSFTRRYEEQTVSFDAAASVRLDPSATPAVPSEEDNSAVSEENEYGDDEGYGSYGGDDYTTWDEYEDGFGEDEDGFGGYTTYDEYEEEHEDDWDRTQSVSSMPELLLDFQMNASGLPRSLPADSVFSLSASVLGAVYPDYAFRLNGETKKDGSVILSLCKPYSGDDEPVVICRCSGTLFPAVSPKDVPDYKREPLDDIYNVFSLNEQTLAQFTDEVIRPLVSSIISFVAEAPTAACQSFLDDLTDIGLLEMILD